MSAPGSYQDWWKSLPIPWLVGGPNGQKEATALGSVFDQQVSLVKLATTAHMPDYAPTDALAHIGGDRQLEQGPNETNANFVTRLKTAWDDWARAGTALELLVQLYWGGFGGAVIAQQNGLLYSLSAAPTAGADPTSLLQINLGLPNLGIAQIPRQTIEVYCFSGGALGTAQFDTFVNGYSAATVTPPASSSGTWVAVKGSFTWVHFPSVTYSSGDTLTINPDGTTTLVGSSFSTATYNSAPWWSVDADQSHTNRFVILFPGSSLGGGSGFVTSATATFTGAEDGVTVPWPTATWNNAFADTTYKTQRGAIYSSSMVEAVIDGTTKTKTGVQVKASAPFVGTVDVLAWEAGANPFADIHAADLARLRRLIYRWKPQKSICAGVYQIVKLPVWGYPTSGYYFGGTNWTWSAGNSVFVEMF